ncbi:MAG: leucine-rich repeat domain-containing protein [Clostridia bacterium]|nr:leucine-rich repeat domain-containing protein [Clostridia bacterium]
MKRMMFLPVLLFLLLPVMALAEAACPLCGGASELCLTDEIGAVYCSGTLVHYPEEAVITSYTVRAGTAIIGEWAFADNYDLEEVILPEGVVMIGTGAFEGRYNLKRVVLPDSLLIIGEMAFYYCPALEGVELPPHLYAIGPSAFADNWRMTAIDIPATVRYIGSEAFCNTGLTEVWLRTVEFEMGYTIFTPNEQFSKARPLTIHVSEEMLYDEVGNLWHFIDAYESGYNVTFVYDVPYLD